MADIGVHQSFFREAQDQQTKWLASDNMGAESKKHHKEQSKGRPQQTLNPAEANSIFLLFITFFFLSFICF